MSKANAADTIGWQKISQHTVEASSRNGAVKPPTRGAVHLCAPACQTLHSGEPGSAPAWWLGAVQGTLSPPVPSTAALLRLRWGPGPAGWGSCTCSGGHKSPGYQNSLPGRSGEKHRPSKTTQPTASQPLRASWNSVLINLEVMDTQETI